MLARVVHSVLNGSPVAKHVAETHAELRDQRVAIEQLQALMGSIGARVDEIAKDVRAQKQQAGVGLW